MTLPQALVSSASASLRRLRSGTPRDSRWPVHSHFKDTETKAESPKGRIEQLFACLPKHESSRLMP